MKLRCTSEVEIAKTPHALSAKLSALGISSGKASVATTSSPLRSSHSTMRFTLAFRRASGRAKRIFDPDKAPRRLRQPIRAALVSRAASAAEKSSVRAMISSSCALRPGALQTLVALGRFFARIQLQRQNLPQKLAGGANFMRQKLRPAMMTGDQTG
jgi:hypothetical protein